MANRYDTKQLYKYVWYQTALQIRMIPNSFTNTYDTKQLYKYVWRQTALQIRMTQNSFTNTYDTKQIRIDTKQFYKFYISVEGLGPKGLVLFSHEGHPKNTRSFCEEGNSGRFQVVSGIKTVKTVIVSSSLSKSSSVFYHIIRKCPHYKRSF